MDLGAKGRHLLELERLGAMMMTAEAGPRQKEARAFASTDLDPDLDLWRKESMTCLEALGRWRDVRESVSGIRTFAAWLSLIILQVLSMFLWASDKPTTHTL